MNGLPLREVIMLWLGARGIKDIGPYSKAIPSFIIHELWMRRNKRKHEGKSTSPTMVIYNITRNMLRLIQVRRSNFQHTNSWPEILLKLEEYKPRLRIVMIKWELPLAQWIKYNTDGTLRVIQRLAHMYFA